MARRRKIARYTPAQLTEVALDQATDAQYVKLLAMIANGWRVTQTDFLQGCDPIIWVRTAGNVPMQRAIRPDGSVFHVSPGFKGLPYPNSYTPRMRDRS